jgi:hypothetical protein
MRSFSIIDAPRQTFSVVLNQRRCTLTINYNVTTKRWNLDLGIDGVLVMHGRRIVSMIDLLQPFEEFGIGAIFVFDPEGKNLVPDYDNLVSGRVLLCHVTPDEIATVRLESAA